MRTTHVLGLCTAFVLIIAGISVSFASEPEKEIRTGEENAQAYKILDCKLVDEGYSYTINKEYEEVLHEIYPDMSDEEIIVNIALSNSNARNVLANKIADNSDPSNIGSNYKIAAESGYYLVDDMDNYSFVSVE